MQRKQLNIAVDDASSPIRGRFDNAAPADEAQLHVRRLSSPIFAEGTLEQEEHDIRDESADAIQAWWRKTRTLQTAAAAADSAAAAFAKIATLVDSLESASKPSFESAQAELQTPPLQQAAAAALSCLSRDPVLAARPHAARSARAFLSAVMIAAFPAEVLSEDPEVSVLLHCTGSHSLQYSMNVMHLLYSLSDLGTLALACLIVSTLQVVL
jgi:cytochrome P450